MSKSSSDYELILFEKQRKENVAKELVKKRQSLDSEFNKFNEEWDAEMRLIGQKYLLKCIKSAAAYQEEYKALQNSISNKLTTFQNNSLSANSRLKEIEAKHMRLVEEQQKKQLETRFKQLLSDRNEIECLFNQCLQLSIAVEVDHKNDQILHTIKHDLQSMNAILQKFDFILNKHEFNDFDPKNVQDIKQEVQRLYRQIMYNIEAVKQNKQKSEPNKIIESIDKSVAEVTKSTLNNSEPVLQSDDIIKEYLKLQTMSNNFEDSFKRFATESGFKQRKNDLQLYVKTTINTISSESVEHIRDKLNRLTQLFSERPVEYSGRQIKCNSNDGSLAFCMSLASKMFISVCTKQKDIALTMAPIISLLWLRFSTFGQIFLAQLQEKCPYVVPFYPHKESDEDETNYLIACGYSISKDGTQESEESFLNRMRAMIKLYSAVIQCNIESGHPHGLKYGWNWMARVLNQEPRPAISAAVLEAFLSISSHKMLRFYGRQFAKLTEFIQRDYTKRIESVTLKDTKRQSLVKLEMFIEDLSNKIRRNVSPKVLEPEGLIPDYFFQSSFSFSRGMSYKT